MVDTELQSGVKPPVSGRSSVKILVVKTSCAFIVLASVLLVSAGTLHWGMAWAYLAVLLVGQVHGGLIQARSNAGLLEERSRLHQGYKKWDIPLATFLAWSPLLILLVAGLEYRHSTLHDPWKLHCWVGLCLTVAGYALTVWAMSVHRFFSPVVRIQAERGHSVVDRGPYKAVRHPGYVGFGLYAVGTALALDSLRAFVPVVAVLLVIALRTHLEDRTLQRELDAYARYATRVRYRLVPGIW